MRLSERDIKTGINSEIHASLRRLEDANAISESVQAKNLGQVVDSLNTTNSNVSKLRTEIYKLHSYLEPHIMGGDLCLFQNLNAGNLVVANGASFSGNVIMNSVLTVKGMLSASAGMMVSDSGIFSPRAVSIDGDNLGGTKVLATGDLTFSLAGLVEGGWSGRKYAVKSKKNQTEVLSTTVTVETHYEYNDTYKQYRTWSVLKEGSETLYTTANAWTGLDAYNAGKEDGGEKHTHSVTLTYTGDGPNLYRASKDLGEGSKVVYY